MSAITLVIGNKNYSSWSLRPWLLLGHFGVDFTERNISLFTPDMASQLGPVSPTMKVPVLHHNGVVVWDSLSICEYANEVLLEGKGWPQDIAARAMARAACAEMHSGFNILRGRWPMNCRLQKPLPVDDKLGADIQRIDFLWQECLNRFGGSEGYLFNHFSIADCFFAPVVVRFHSYQPVVSETASAYMKKMLGNAALQEWIAAGKAETAIIDEDEVDFLMQQNPENY